jgi:hypothetical protein
LPKEYTLAPKLKLIVDHLKAVRTLDEYVSGVGLKKDMQDFSNHLQQDLSRNVFRPIGWEEVYAAAGNLYSSPKSSRLKSSSHKSTWRVAKNDVIAVEICCAWPVPFYEEPSVGLYVPANWKKRSQFIAKLKAPPGFEHVSQYPDGELSEDTSVFKYIPYASFVGAEGLFDSTGFIDAFREAAKTLVAMEKFIDGVLERLG